MTKRKKPAQKPGKHKNQKQPAPKTGKPAKANAPKLNIHLFGTHAVREAWLNPKRHIHALYLTESSARQFEPVLKQAKDLKRPDPQIVDKTALDKALPLGTVHQGIGLTCQPLAENSVQDLIIQAESKPSSLFLILDQVTDPHNVGAILRSACVFGANGLIMQSRHAPALEGILTKTACGAADHTPVAYETNLSRTIETLKEAGYFIYGLDEKGIDIPQNDQNAPKRIACVLGAEGPGIRHLIKENCDELIKLPTSGPISSLNVSNAAAVALYALSQK